MTDVAKTLGPLPQRAGHLPMRDAIDLYMAHYAGRDTTRLQRLGWWQQKLDTLPLQDLGDDQVHAALEELAQQPSRYYAGDDAEGKPIYKAKRKPISPATINRYAASLAAVITWTIKRRIAPRGFVHPCRSIERQTEASGKTRFLSDDERARLLDACRAAPWPRMYVLALMGLTTGARKGELLALRWEDVDLERAVATCGRSKNGDPKVLPVVPAVVEILRSFSGKPSELVFPCATPTSLSHSRSSGRMFSSRRRSATSDFTTCGTAAPRCSPPQAPPCWRSRTCWGIDSCR